jgi:hypothetical protein
MKELVNDKITPTVEDIGCLLFKEKTDYGIKPVIKIDNKVENEILGLNRCTVCCAPTEFMRNWASTGACPYRIMRNEAQHAVPLQKLYF